jgi:hypothetical protein
VPTKSIPETTGLCSALSPKQKVYQLAETDSETFGFSGQADGPYRPDQQTDY